MDNALVTRVAALSTSPGRQDGWELQALQALCSAHPLVQLGFLSKQDDSAACIFVDQLIQGACDVVGCRLPVHRAWTWPCPIPSNESCHALPSMWLSSLNLAKCPACAHCASVS